MINATLDETLAEQERDLDADTRCALAWLEQNGFTVGAYGIAKTPSKAKNTSIDGLAAAGILERGQGKVRLRSSRSSMGLGRSSLHVPALFDPAPTLQAAR